MGFLIPLLILAFPAAEIYVLIKVGRAIGFWDTVFLLFFSACFGVYLAKQQGQVTLVRIQQSLREGRVPTLEMLDGLLIFVGGVLFIVPGFISDGLGLLLVFPPTRWLVRWVIGQRIQVRAAAHPGPSFGTPVREQRERPFTGTASRGQVQDAEVVREPKDDKLL